MKLIIVTGQTATGKTNKALELAEKYNGELINCDSRQIYKGLDIITGKDIPKSVESRWSLVERIDDFDIGFYSLPTTNDQRPACQLARPIPIWLYDIVDPQQHFSSFEYAQCATAVIGDILSRKKTPILVGGTGFYLRHLLTDMAQNKVEPDWNLRAELSLLTLNQLQDKLKKIDKDEYEGLNNSEKNNPQRLIRRIEITSAPKDLQTVKQTNNDNYLANLLGLKSLAFEWRFFFKEREELELLIRNRVQNRLDEGAIDEVKKLLDKGYQENDPGMKTIGYQQLIGVVKGKCDLETAVNEWTVRELQYAKCQKTYLKKLAADLKASIG